jgi:predicted small lipoprotein YifL
MKLMRILPVLAAGLFIGACGTKGPLYLPKPVPAAQKPLPVVVPPAAPERPTPAESTPAPK